MSSESKESLGVQENRLKNNRADLSTLMTDSTIDAAVVRRLQVLTGRSLNGEPTIA